MRWSRKQNEKDNLIIGIFWGVGFELIWFKWFFFMLGGCIFFFPLWKKMARRQRRYKQDGILLIEGWVVSVWNYFLVGDLWRGVCLVLCVGRRDERRGGWLIFHLDDSP
jgi:membrane-associated phospholipid phosphatase